MKFYIKQKVFSFRDKFNVMDENQNTVYQVKGKVFSLHNKLELLDQTNAMVLRSQRKLFRIFPQYQIFDPSGEELATIKAKFSIRPKFDLLINNELYEVEGSLFAHSFGINKNGQLLASISKKIISWGDTYEIEIFEDKNVELFLFVVIVLDQVIHERRRG